MFDYIEKIEAGSFAPKILKIIDSCFDHDCLKLDIDKVARVLSGEFDNRF
jgi:hypothetical protein